MPVRRNLRRVFNNNTRAHIQAQNISHSENDSLYDRLNRTIGYMRGSSTESNFARAGLRQAMLDGANGDYRNNQSSGYRRKVKAFYYRQQRKAMGQSVG